MIKTVASVANVHRHCLKLFPSGLYFCLLQPIVHEISMPVKCFHSSRYSLVKNDTKKTLMVFRNFEKNTDKTKKSYLEMVNFYERQNPTKRGHVEFIYAALKHMDEFGVSKDLDVYKALINVMPKGKMIPTNLFQVEFMHYPKQQQCIIDLLEKMEDNGVIPDAEMEPMLLNIFGNKGFPLRRYWRMMYWMPKFKNLSPWKIPNPPPDNALLLAHLAIKRITSVDLQTKVDVYQCDDLEDAVDKTWIVSGISPTQIKLLQNHPTNLPVIVEGGGRVWLRSRCVNYFILKADATEKFKPPSDDIDDVSRLRIPYFNTNKTEEGAVAKLRTLHEQDDGTVYAVCATGTSSKDSALSWIRFLQQLKAPILETLPVLFRFRQTSGELVPFDENTNSYNKTETIDKD